jgi:hypothetical protein
MESSITELKAMNLDREAFQGKFSRVTFRAESGEVVYVDLNNCTLNLIRGRRWVYDVDLERCANSAELLDWIMQLEGKGWVSIALLGLVVKVLDACIQAQSNLCSGGHNRDIPAGKIRALIKDNLRRTITWSDEWALQGVHITWK